MEWKRKDGKKSETGRREGSCRAWPTGLPRARAAAASTARSTVEPVSVEWKESFFFVEKFAKTVWLQVCSEMVIGSMEFWLKGKGDTLHSTAKAPYPEDLNL